MDAEAVLEDLRSGNQRWAAGSTTWDGLDPAERRELARGQSPKAAVLGCADSRVPVELVFDQRPGDLFVVRVAGNVADPSQIGSLEFAVDALGVRVVVVLGHTSCGAVLAAGADTSGLPHHLRELVGAVRPDGRENVGAAVATLEATLQGAAIVGAEYDLETGVVAWLS